jgi:hypothetical protein
MVTAAGAGCRDMLAFIQRKTTQRYTRQMVMAMRMMRITGSMLALMTDRVQPAGHSNGILSTRKTNLHSVCLEESGWRRLLRL